MLDPPDPSSAPTGAADMTEDAFLAVQGRRHGILRDIDLTATPARSSR